MKTSLIWKSLLTMPSLMGIALAVAPMPTLAESQVPEAEALATPTVTTPQAPLSNTPPPAIEPVSPANPILLSTRAADLQATSELTPQVQTWQQGQGNLSQFSAQKMGSSTDTASTSAVNLDQVAAELTTSAPTIGFSPSDPAMDQMLLASQDLIGCRVPGLICPSPNPAQYVPPPGSTPSTTEPAPTEPPTTAATPSNRWHFLLTPFIWLPVSIYGDATVKGYTADVSLGPNSIFSAVRNTLQFAFFGRTEAWTPDYHLGFLLGGDYLAAGKNNVFTRPNPDRLVDAVINRVADRIQNRLDDSQRQRIADLIKNSGLDNGQIRDQIEAIVGQRLGEIIPSEFKSDVKVQTWGINLAVAYRFYNASQVNPKGVATEFDLGPFLFDIFGGIRFGGTSSDIDVTTNLGGEGDFSKSIFTVLPYIGGRVRYNAAHNLALLASASATGFGINSAWQWDASAGVDWMFSGNTSISAGWRFAYAFYETGSGRDAFGINLNNNGPYVGFTFRF